MNKKYILLGLLGVSTLSIWSCSKGFLDKTPQGQLVEEQIANKKGIEAELVGAYAIMNGNVNGTWGNYASAPSQWLFGEVTSDNAHKGSVITDQPNMNMIETFSAISSNDNLSTMWQVYYEGVLRSNNTLRLLKLDQAGAKTVAADRAKQIEGEAKMLRAHYYFFLWRIFKNIPYVDENTTIEEAKVVKNDQDVLPKIEADLKDAITLLPTTKINSESGRMDQIIAKAYLGKLYLYQKKYPQALLLFKDVMAVKDIAATSFQDNFDPTKENGTEAILVAKHTINPDGSGDNGNVGDMLSGLNGANPVGCCGFYQPTIDLVNAYKVDANGLPLLDNSYKNNPYTSDILVPKADLPKYVLDTKLHFDPRLDYTVGRRGVAFLDYGIFPGDAWLRPEEGSRPHGGPFTGIKTMIPKSLHAAHTASGAAYITDLDVNIIRLADVVLMAAECEVEANNLPEAMRLVNLIRNRAAKLPGKTTVDGKPAAVYVVKPYLTFPDQAYARKAVKFERRLELALEGHRFFDLVRWGDAKQVIESYSAFEGTILPIFKGIQFTPNRNEYFPIPQEELNKSMGNLKQNAGY
ncbi:RagB/SusD family nutrient uptake outer membrane protein [Sphingobacterium sp. SRCM116780]|uniref:RagB/SusD family nutrient uptake outer membrane protein n=1 Tax=Sphingobacterium sp. SRCM116780 TaxID=2907623 RepID=UPI001F3BED6A|nr:RagB/SusD family nutrient uptake outer membrane protein [Sphingobacterium sp. SRCM116780]UIR57055.1 RagB/SusD family nutrient uptake outer membrane protein [Sphingobacterium sp. SRCM116780]